MLLKTETVTIRMEPEIKRMLRAAAQKERRSIANLIEVMIVDYANRLGVARRGRGVGGKSPAGHPGREMP